MPSNIYGVCEFVGFFFLCFSLHNQFYELRFLFLLIFLFFYFQLKTQKCADENDEAMRNLGGAFYANIYILFTVDAIIFLQLLRCARFFMLLLFFFPRFHAAE